MTAKVGVFTRHDLDGYSATEENLRTCLEISPNAELVVFYGHGKADCLVAQTSSGQELPVVRTISPGVTPEEVVGRKVYAVACHAGTALGPSLALKACEFVGYDEGFSLVKYFERDFGEVVNVTLLATELKSAVNTTIPESPYHQIDANLPVL